MRNTKFLLVFAVSLVLVLGVVIPTFPLADALKSSGNSLPETNSKRVCGVSLCDSPMTIEEKIRMSLNLNDESQTFMPPGGIHQQQSIPTGSADPYSNYSGGLNLSGFHPDQNTASDVEVEDNIEMGDSITRNSWYGREIMKVVDFLRSVHRDSNDPTDGKYEWLADNIEKYLDEGNFYVDKLDDNAETSSITNNITLDSDLFSGEPGSKGFDMSLPRGFSQMFSLAWTIAHEKYHAEEQNFFFHWGSNLRATTYAWIWGDNPQEIDAWLVTFDLMDAIIVDYSQRCNEIPDDHEQKLLCISQLHSAINKKLDKIRAWNGGYADEYGGTPIPQTLFGTLQTWSERLGSILEEAEEKELQDSVSQTAGESAVSYGDTEHNELVSIEEEMRNFFGDEIEQIMGDRHSEIPVLDHVVTGSYPVTITPGTNILPGSSTYENLEPSIDSRNARFLGEKLVGVPFSLDDVTFFVDVPKLPDGYFYTGKLYPVTETEGPLRTISSSDIMPFVTFQNIPAYKGSFEFSCSAEGDATIKQLVRLYWQVLKGNDPNDQSSATKIAEGIVNFHAESRLICIAAIPETGTTTGETTPGTTTGETTPGTGTSTGSADEASYLLINGEHYNIDQFFVSEPDVCLKPHYHSSLVFVESIEGSILFDPAPGVNPPECGFGTVDSIKVVAGVDLPKGETTPGTTTGETTPGTTTGGTTPGTTTGGTTPGTTTGEEKDSPPKKYFIAFASTPSHAWVELWDGENVYKRGLWAAGHKGSTPGAALVHAGETIDKDNVPPTPEEANAFATIFYGGSGAIKDEGKTQRGTSWIGFEITEAEYNQTVDYINGASTDYSVASRNCVDFDIEVAGQLGITLPSATEGTTAGYFYSDPEAFEINIRGTSSTENGRNEHIGDWRSGPKWIKEQLQLTDDAQSSIIDDVLIPSAKSSFIGSTQFSETSMGLFFANVQRVSDASFDLKSSFNFNDLLISNSGEAPIFSIKLQNPYGNSIDTTIDGWKSTPLSSDTILLTTESTPIYPGQSLELNLEIPGGTDTLFWILGDENDEKIGLGMVTDEPDTFSRISSLLESGESEIFVTFSTSPDISSVIKTVTERVGDLLEKMLNKGGK